MSYQCIEEEVLKILRLRSLAGSTRDVCLDQPLGATGLGLDSLGLVQFVSSLEKLFGMEIPDDIWFEKGLLTVRDFVEIIRQGRTEKVAPAYRSVEDTLETLPVNASYLRRIREAFSHAGVRGGIQWTWGRGIRKMRPLLYQPVNHVILLHDLTTGRPSIGPLHDGLTIRETPFLSDNEVADLWPRHERRAMMRLMQRRARAGYICLTAWMGDEIVGIDWLSLSGDYDPSTGLEIRTTDGCCYAMNLYEKYRGKGIGLALLAASLEEGRRRGCTSQVTIVRESNMRMMSVATQMFGFRQIGSIRTHRVLGKATSTWKKNGQENRNSAVTLPLIVMALQSWELLQTLIPL
jgi:acyl carrier protein/GNAT superfamily N-acetyltransferase